MATGHRMGPVREQGLLERVWHLAREANPAFAAGSILVPLALLGVAVALENAALLFYTHVATGAVWFAFAVIFPALIGPVLGGLDPEDAAKVTAGLTPKVVFFLLGFSLTTVLSGTVLLTDAGFGYGFTGFWENLALGTGWGLFLFGLVVPNRLHLRAYYEGISSNPDPTVLEDVERKNLIVGLFELVVMLGIVGVMTGLRLGL